MLNFIKRVFGLLAVQAPVAPVAPYKIEEPAVAVEATVAPAAMTVVKKPRKAKAKPTK